MSSNESLGSSRLSQFGLYRTIDARTEEFLKLSRKRQVRQGCACAAVSTAVTVTVVVCVLFLYGYGIGSSTASRSPSWLDLVNLSDAALFQDKLKNTIQLDRAAMKLLPIFLDKILEHDSSSPKYETKSSTEYKFEKEVFSGTNILTKTPNSRLFTIQYKTYPIVYIHSPRNTDNFLKLRKTREYERIMSYVDKMISDKVGIGSSRSVRNKPPIDPQNLVGNKIFTSIPPPVNIKKTKINYKTINRDSKDKPYTNKDPNLKLNHTKINDKNNNCKCHNPFRRLLDKLIKCFQKLSKEVNEQPCSNMAERNVGNFCGHYTERTTTQSSLTKKNIRLLTHNIINTATFRPHNVIITSTAVPKGKFDSAGRLLQNLFKLDHSKLKTKDFSTQMPSLSFKKNNETKYVSKVNKLGKQSILNSTFTKPQNKYNFKNDKYTGAATPTTSPKSSSTKYTTSTGKYDDIFQEILFPEGNIFETTTNVEESLRKSSVHLSNHYEISIKKPTFKKQIEPTNKELNILKVKNITDQKNIRPNPKYPNLYPEEIVFEKFRQKNDKLLKEMEPRKSEYDIDNKRLKDTKNMIGKFRELLSGKPIQPQRKNLYKNSTPQMKNSKPFPKFQDDMQSFQSQYTDKATKAKQEMHTPQTITTTRRIPSSTLITPVISNTPELKVTTQLQKYSHEESIPETTTPVDEKEMKLVTPIPKLERKKTLNIIDIWNEFDPGRIPNYKNLEKDFKEMTPTPPNRSTTEISTTINQSSHISAMKKENKLNDEAFNNTQYFTSIEKHGEWEEAQTTENYLIYKSIFPIGRKSYLEISRDDWKQSEPHFNIDNYEAFDELEE